MKHVCVNGWKLLDNATFSAESANQLLSQAQEKTLVYSHLVFYVSSLKSSLFILDNDFPQTRQLKRLDGNVFLCFEKQKERHNELDFHHCQYILH